MYSSFKGITSLTLACGAICRTRTSLKTSWIQSLDVSLKSLKAKSVWVLLHLWHKPWIRTFVSLTNLGWLIQSFSVIFEGSVHLKGRTEKWPRRPRTTHSTKRAGKWLCVQALSVVLKDLQFWWKQLINEQVWVRSELLKSFSLNKITRYCRSEARLLATKLKSIFYLTLLLLLFFLSCSRARA